MSARLLSSLVAALAAAIFIVIFASGVAAAREWSSSSGKFKVTADFVKLEDGKVTLRKPSGELVTVDYAKLSERDRKFIDSQTGGETSPAGESGSQGKSGAPGKSGATEPKGSVAVSTTRRRFFAGADPDDLRAPVRTFSMKLSNVRYVALSSDARFAGAATHDKVAVVDTTNGQKVLEVEVDDVIGSCRGFAFVANQPIVVVLGEKGRGIVYQAEANGQFAEIKQLFPSALAKYPYFRSAAISRDGRLAAMAIDEQILIWNLQTGGEPVKVLRPKDRGGRVEHLGFGGGSASLSCLTSEGFRRVDTKSWSDKPIGPRGHVHYSGESTYSPDGRFMAAGSHDKVLLVDMNSGTTIRSFAVENPTRPSFTPDGVSLVVAGKEELVVFQVSNGKKLLTVPRDRDDRLSHWIVAADADNRHVLVHQQYPDRLSLYQIAVD